MVLLARGGSPSLLFRPFYLIYLLSLNLESLIRRANTINGN